MHRGKKGSSFFVWIDCEARDARAPQTQTTQRREKLRARLHAGKCDLSGRPDRRRIRQSNGGEVEESALTLKPTYVPLALPLV